ncbi:hypothetical protein [Cohnella nanjingensis]|uniref:Head decoration protein n=1 Tax=Cohnella nanjingensis TaxID=1387779 RepID=A0A7X0VE25_9BACL|nr:hypothetical protein [Cohnella nanjingensis]MBB6670271.1 hypothetical protein [Cohnella nanjingensis]
MPYVKDYGKREEINFLASADYTAFTYQVNDSGVTPNANGRKIVPAGSVFPINDATAIGILLSDVDVTNGPQPGAVIVEGWLLEARLPTAPVAAAKTAMKAIKFKTVV